MRLSNSTAKPTKSHGCSEKTQISLWILAVWPVFPMDCIGSQGSSPWAAKTAGVQADRILLISVCTWFLLVFVMLWFMFYMGQTWFSCSVYSFYSEQAELKSSAAEQLSRGNPRTTPSSKVVWLGHVTCSEKNVADRFLPPLDLVFERFIFAFPFKKKSNLQIWSIIFCMFIVFSCYSFVRSIYPTAHFCKDLYVQLRASRKVW